MDWMWDMRETEFEDDSVDLKDRRIELPLNQDRKAMDIAGLGIQEQNCELSFECVKWEISIQEPK